jgi:hypothetical protein
MIESSCQQAAGEGEASSPVDPEAKAACHQQDSRRDDDDSSKVSCCGCVSSDGAESSHKRSSMENTETDGTNSEQSFLQPRKERRVKSNRASESPGPGKRMRRDECERVSALVPEPTLLSFLTDEEDHELTNLVEKHTKLSEQVAELWNRVGLVRCHLQHDPVRSLACHNQALDIYQNVFSLNKKSPADCGIVNCPCPVCELSSEEWERRNVLLATVYTDMGLCHERMHENALALSCYYNARQALTVSFGSDCCTCKGYGGVNTASSSLDNDSLATSDSSSDFTEQPDKCCGPKFLSESVRRSIARIERS